MAHLGADVAAYVDGQLSEPAMNAATTHLEACDDCAKAVRQQRLVKSRMSTVMSPEPPAQLLASLAGLAAATPTHDSWWTRLRHSLPFRAGVALMGASAVVVLAAYAVGGAGDSIGDEVAPPFDRYAADFGGTASIVSAANVITDSRMDELDGSGWPCARVLAGDLQRTSGAYADHDEVVKVAYTNGIARLDLFEQNGALDPDSLDSFTQRQIGGSKVWVRHGSPTLVTWDDDGVVYTIVTDADADRLARAIKELPRSAYDPGLVDRIGDGINRMSAWVDAA